MTSRSLVCLLAAHAAVSLSASARAEPPAAADAPSSDAVSERRVAMSLGFSHWYGATFGSPDGVTTPMIAVGVRPGLSFLEIKARYTRSTVAHDAPLGSRALVGFAALELLASRELRFGRQSLSGFVGPFAMFTHAGADGPPIGFGAGVVLGAELLVRTGLAQSHAFGLFVATHEVFYTLPGDQLTLTEDPRRDAQVDIGLLTTLF